MATATSIQAVLGTDPAEREFGNALRWYRAVADAGHAADAVPGLMALAKKRAEGGAGTERFTAYGVEMKPYAAMLRAAGAM